MAVASENDEGEERYRDRAGEKDRKKEGSKSGGSEKMCEIVKYEI